MGWYRTNQVLVPRLAGIFQRFANVFLCPFFQIDDLRVRNPVWKIAHVPFQISVHRLQASGKKFQMLVGGAKSEPLIGASSWIGDEVGKGLVERPNGLVDVFLEDEER